MNQNKENKTNNSENLLAVNDLKTYFPVKKGLLRKTVGYIKAVNGVSFNIQPGRTFGLVGESGCGKTTVARSIIRLIPPTDGKVIFDHKDLTSATSRQLRQIRSRISLIFQDPYGSLNPRMTVANIVGEPVKIHKGYTGTKLRDYVADLLRKVGLSPEYINRYPHEFSGGQRQRIGIARALALRPELIICDEPVSALDVSIQSQILNLLKDLQDEFNLTYLFIAHDLAVVEYACDDIAVMYMGKIVEQAPAEILYKNPMHPYTRLLISAIPTVEPGKKSSPDALKGEVPSAMHPPSGCPFHPRCPLARNICRRKMPPLRNKDSEKYHYLACWKWENYQKGLNNNNPGKKDST